MMIKLSHLSHLLQTCSIATLSALLIACGSGANDDLDLFMENAATGVSKSVEALPEVLPYSPLQYNADGTLNDPFKARKAVSKSGDLQPNTNRAKEQLEAYPLESLKYVGSMTKNSQTFALVKTPDNSIQQVKSGNYIGPNYGLVTSINDSEIVLKEIVQDDLTGDWVERSASINLQE